MQSVLQLPDMQGSRIQQAHMHDGIAQLGAYWKARKPAAALRPNHSRTADRFI